MSIPEGLKKARSVAFRYLAYRDRTRQEIKNHLSKKGFSKVTIGETIEYLTENRYLDDERFAMDWGRTRLRSKKIGKQRLRQELAAKGLGPATVEHTLQTLYADIDEVGLAESCAQKKLPGLQGLDQNKKRRRLAQYLQRKGFQGDTVYQTVQRLVPFDAEEGKAPQPRSSKGTASGNALSHDRN